MPYADKELGRSHHKTYMLKRRYGLTQAEYDAMWEAQGRCCAICKRAKNPSRKGWQVDHDHVTKRVRGILCINCNRDLRVAENTAFMAAAQPYLHPVQDWSREDD